MNFTDFLKALFDPFRAIFGDPERDRILAEGKSAVAKITALNEVGSGYVTVNDQPYVALTLEIYPKGEEPYTTSIKTLISRLATSQFQPGNMINVKIDPLDKLKVVLDYAGASKPVVGNTDSKMSENTKDAMAEILEIRKTDRVKDGNKIYEMKFEVSGSDLQTYSFTKEIPLPEYALTHFNVGRKYQCKVDAEDKTKLALDIKF